MKTHIFQEAMQKVRNVFRTARPRCAFILGSGWGEVAETFITRESISYADIPCLGSPEVKGHSGHMLLSEFAGLEIFFFQGRRHWYEGAGWEPIALPIHFSRGFGVSVIVLTNSAGGIRDGLKPGDLMVIDDHINAMGVNPLIGNYDPAWGPRFPDQTQVYDVQLRELLDKAGAGTGMKLQHGVYIATSGPTYETPAEISAFCSMGADAVGMSTVPEAMLAHSIGLRVAGVSCITNLAAGIGHSVLSHEEVVRLAHDAEPRMKALITEFLREMALHIFNDE